MPWPVPTDSNTSFSPVRLRYISVRVPSRSETGDTPPSCLTNPAPRLLTVENRFAGLSAKIDRVIDRRPFNFVSSVHLYSNKGLNDRVRWRLVRRNHVRDISKRRENKVVASWSFTRFHYLTRENKISIFTFSFVGIKLDFFLFSTNNCEISLRVVVDIQKFNPSVIIIRYIDYFFDTLHFLTQEFLLLPFQPWKLEDRIGEDTVSVWNGRRECSIRYYNWINTRVDNSFRGSKNASLSFDLIKS